MRNFNCIIGLWSRIQITLEFAHRFAERSLHAGNRRLRRLCPNIVVGVMPWCRKSVDRSEV